MSAATPLSSFFGGLGVGAGSGVHLGFNTGSGTGSSSSTYNNTTNQNLTGGQSTSVQPLTPQELAYIQGLNPAATNLNYGNPLFNFGAQGMSGIANSGFSASPQQLGYLQSIMGNQIGATNTALQYQMNNPQGELNTVNQDLANTGMTQSSVAPWMYGGVMQSYLSQLGQASQNAAAQYGQNATTLPYQSANVYGSMANLGQAQQGLNTNAGLGAFNSLYAGNLSSPTSNFTQGGTTNTSGTTNTNYSNNTGGFNLGL